MIARTISVADMCPACTRPFVPGDIVAISADEIAEHVGCSMRSGAPSTRKFGIINPDSISPERWREQCLRAFKEFTESMTALSRGHEWRNFSRTTIDIVRAQIMRSIEALGPERSRGIKPGMEG